MALPSYRRHRFPPEIIQNAIWLYFRFTLSYRDVEELVAERGLDISYETVRRWVLKFGPAIARSTAAPASPSAERSLASRRNGGADRRRADVAMAGGRSRGPRVRIHLPPAESRVRTADPVALARSPVRTGLSVLPSPAIEWAALENGSVGSCKWALDACGLSGFSVCLPP
jgi:hypothetical protein